VTKRMHKTVPAARIGRKAFTLVIAPPPVRTGPARFPRAARFSYKGTRRQRTRGASHRRAVAEGRR
jgi:hypothetical protein